MDKWTSAESKNTRHTRPEVLLALEQKTRRHCYFIMTQQMKQPGGQTEDMVSLHRGSGRGVGGVHPCTGFVSLGADEASADQAGAVYSV